MEMRFGVAQHLNIHEGAAEVGAHRLGDASHVGHKGCSFFGREVGEIGRMPATPNGLRVTTLRDSPTKVCIEMGRGKKADAARCSPRRPTLPTHVAPVTIAST
jgi:hypothetical protein